jgi:hypothetical protein
MAETTSTGLVDRVARLVRSLVDLKALPAQTEHLGHERERPQCRVRTKGREDLLLGPYFDPFSRPEVERC